GHGLGDIGDGKLLVPHDHGAHGSPLLLEAGFAPPGRRLGWVASEAGGLDALDGAILVAVGRVAADPDRADVTALPVQDEHAARNGNELTLRGRGDRALEGRPVLQPVPDRARRDAHAAGPPRLALAAAPR